LLVTCELRVWLGKEISESAACHSPSHPITSTTYFYHTKIYSGRIKFESEHVLYLVTPWLSYVCISNLGIIRLHNFFLHGSINCVLSQELVQYQTLQGVIGPEVDQSKISTQGDWESETGKLVTETELNYNCV